MKGFAFNIFIFMIIAIISVMILLAVLNSIIPNFIGKSLCKLYRLVLFLPFPKNMRVSIPGCSIIPEMERIHINQINSQILSDYIIDCWDKSNQGKTGQTFICYEIFSDEIQESFNENDLNSVLRSKNFCRLIPNNYLEKEQTQNNCGDDNKINWIFEETERVYVTIIIKYNSEYGQIEVI